MGDSATLLYVVCLDTAITSCVNQDSQNLFSMVITDKWVRLEKRNEPWNYSIEDGLVRNHADGLSLEPVASHMTHRCAWCKTLLSGADEGPVSISHLEKGSKECAFCALLCKQATKFDELGSSTISNINSVLTLQPKGYAISRIYPVAPSQFHLGSQGRSEDAARTIESMLLQPVHNHYPIYAASSRLLFSWLQNCDENHDCWNSPKYKKRFLPTRLLNVKPSGDLGQVRLDAMMTIEGNQYLALSHCWGQSATEKMPMWLTLVENLGSRMVGFKLDELPKTFQDAVQITRELGISYLWIDSLCIIQDDTHDWNRESKRMEDVYASAYCTIAAASAPNSGTGFLGDIKNNDSLFIQDDDGNVAYVSTNVADFEHDVNAASLNQRAWVMQERFLSPRTIHFTDTQVYGECGDGVYAGDSIFLRSRRGTRKFFEVDPKFPNRLRSSGFATTWEFLRALLENYTHRGITEPSDRAIAISGLMARVKKALPCPIHHGIIDWYLHRSLLWKRAKGDRRKKIDYRTSNVPSWSWMAHEGIIEFLPNEFGTLDRFGHLTFDKTTLTTIIWEFIDPNMTNVAESGDGCHRVFDSNGSLRGWIIPDEETEFSLQNVAILSRAKGTRAEGCNYYVLFVQPTKLREWYEGQEHSWEASFERIGIGMLQGSCNLRNTGEGYIF
ncbi:TOL-like protein [Colletotrichum tofieldiae]|uniref:TOL-like protein n=1 Tax=Colletotrichum tofieldiae TaxID=708197 RepID=A0A166R4X9_9PEZI|nr:TOL-like protein [Colletotrichum tofieldiae]